MGTVTLETASVCVDRGMKARSVKTSARDGPLVKSVARDVSVTRSTATPVGERTGSVSVTPRGLV